MITQQTIVNLTPTLDVLNSLKIRLAVKPGTVLADLYSTNAALINGGLQINGIEKDFPTFVEDVTGDVIDGNNITKNDHSAKLDNYIDEISGLVQKHVNFAKTVVNPKVEELGNLIIETMNKGNILSADGKMIVDGSDFSDIDIINEDIPELLKNASFLSSLDTYKSIKVAKQTFPEGVAFINKDKIADLCLVGEKEIDKLIMEFVSSEFMTHHLDKYLRMFATNSGWMDCQGGAGHNVFQRLRFLTGAYLIASKLNVGGSEDCYTSSLSLNEFRKYVAIMRDSLGWLIVDLLEMVNKYAKADRVVIDSNNGLEKNITVYKPRYEEWLEAGGCPEILLGAFVAGNISDSATSLIENSEKYCATWKSYLAVNSIRIENIKFDKFKGYVKDLFDISLQNLTEEEQETSKIVGTVSDFMKKVNALATKEIMDLKVADVEKPYEVALRLVAKCRYFYTSAWYILKEIHDLTKDNKDMDVREAALIATINYVTEYVKDQIDAA